MTYRLPSNPNFEHLRKEAKDILKDHREGDTRCCEVLQRLSRFADQPQERILAGPLSLVEAQFALAMAYGFRSWAELKRHVATVSSEVQPARLDVSGMDLPTGFMYVDCFSYLNQRIAQLFGHNLEYEAIHCLASNAFAPAIFTGEDCTSWWHHDHRDQCWDLVASVLGLSVTPLQVEGFELNHQLPQQEFEELAFRQRVAYAALMREAIDKGGAVVVEGGWDMAGHHGFVPWVLWGVVTGFPDDTTILAATFNGHDDNPLRYVDRAWAVMPGGEGISRDEADRAMLAHAVDRLYGRGERFSPRDGMLYGLTAMDRWIAQMESVPGFCGPCFERTPEPPPTDADDNGYTLHGGATSVRRYLSGRATAHAPRSDEIEQVAAHYRKIAESIGPFIQEGSTRRYATFIGDLERQRQHAREVLRPIRDEMAAAATILEGLQ